MKNIFTEIFFKSSIFKNAEKISGFRMKYYISNVSPQAE